MVSVQSVRMVPDAAPAGTTTRVEFIVNVTPQQEWAEDESLFIKYYSITKIGETLIEGAMIPFKEGTEAAHVLNNFVNVVGGRDYVFQVFKNIDGKDVAQGSPLTFPVPISTDTVSKIDIENTVIDSSFKPNFGEEKIPYGGMVKTFNSIKANYKLGTAYKDETFHLIWGLITSDDLQKEDQSYYISKEDDIEKEEVKEDLLRIKNEEESEEELENEENEKIIIGTKITKEKVKVEYQTKYPKIDAAINIHKKYTESGDATNTYKYQLLSDYIDFTTISNFDLKDFNSAAAEHGAYYRLVYGLISSKYWVRENLGIDKFKYASFLCYSDIYKYPLSREKIEDNFLIDNKAEVNDIEFSYNEDKSVKNYKRPFNNEVRISLPEEFNYNDLFSNINYLQKTTTEIEEIYEYNENYDETIDGEKQENKVIEEVLEENISTKVIAKISSIIGENWRKELFADFKKLVISISNKSNYSDGNNYQTIYSESSNDNALSKEFNLSLTRDLYNYVKRNNFFALKINLIDGTNTSYETEITQNNSGKPVYLWRINLPSYSSNIITVDKNYPIAIHQSIGDTISFALPTPYDYLTSSDPDIDNFKRIIKQIICTIEEETIILDITDPNNYKNIEYSKGTSNTGIIYFKTDYIKEQFKNYNKLKAPYFDFTVELNHTDAFNNSINTKFIIRYPNTYELNALRINFKAFPIMPQYDSVSKNYKMKLFYLDEEIDLIESSEQEAINTKGNLLNPKDRLIFYFPKATDINENITKYRIKILRKDDPDNFKILSTNNNYSTLVEIEASNLTEVNGGYSYEHIVNNYSISKFVMFGISAVDEDGNESNIAEINDYVLVAGRVQNAQFNITNFYIEDNKLIINLKITDLGGNYFINNKFSYANYPNLDRNKEFYNDETGFIFDIKYDYEGNDGEPILINNSCIFYVDNDSIGNDYYKEEYENLLNKNIKIIVENIKINDDSNIKISETKFYFNVITQFWYGKEEDKVTNLYLYTESPFYTYYPSTATVSYRQNSVGINTKNIGDNILKIAPINQKTKITFEGELEGNPVPLEFNLVDLLIKGIIIVDE